MAKLHHPQAGLLIVRAGRHTMVPLTKDINIIGRKLADIILDDPKISSAHAEIRREGERYFIKDLMSTNGTFLNKKPVSLMALTDQDLIEVGSSSLCFFQNMKDYPQGVEPGDESRSEIVATQVQELTRGAITTTKTMLQSILRLEIKEGPDKGRKFQFRKPFILIGRRDADLVLQDVDVSRQHAMVEIFSQTSLFVKDLGSTNGTFVNGRKIQAEKVQSGDEISVGNTVIRLESGEMETA